MSRWIANALGIFSILAVCLIGWAAWRIGVFADSVKVPDLTASVTRINQALDTVNKPKSGTLSMIDDTILQGRLTIDATNKVLIHEQNQLGTVDGYARNFDSEVSGLASRGNTALDSVARLSDGIARTANAATQTLNTANSTIAAAQPLLASYTRSGDDLDALLKDQAIAGTLAHIEGMTESGDGILADAKKISDKETAQWLKPTPWFLQPVKKAGDIIDIGAAIARHTP